MLDPWIIEQIRKREESRQPQDRPVAEMPNYPGDHPSSYPAKPPKGRDGDSRPDGGGYDGDREPPPSDRGVTIIDFSF